MISTNRKVVTFGEVMLRLTAPDFRRSPRPTNSLPRMVAARLMWLYRSPTSGFPPSLSPGCPTMQWRRHVSHRSVPTGWVRKESYSEGNAWDCIFLRVALRFAIPMWYTIVKGLLCHPASRHDRLGKDICRCRLVSLVGHSGFTVTRGCRRLSGSSTNGRPHGLNHFL